MQFRHLVLAFTFLASLPTLAFAGTIKPWLSATTHASTYAMGDVNDDIAQINSLAAAAGLRMKEIDNGIGFGVAAGLDMGNGFSLGLGFDRLPAQSDVGDWSGSVDYDFPGNFVRGFGRYAFQSSSKANGFLEGSLGRVSAGGDVTVSITGQGSVSGGVEGSGLGFELGAGADYWASPQFAFTGMAGFRHASAKDVEVDGVPVYNTSGEAYSIDYSGVFVRVGLRLVLAQ